MRNAALCILSLLPGCISPESEAPRGDGKALQTIAATRALAPHLRRDVVLIREGEVIRRASAGDLGVLLPSRASGATQLSAGACTVEVRALGSVDADATIEGSAVVHVDAAPSTDVVHLVEPSRVEELRILRDANAPTTFRWTVRASDGCRVRVRERRIEVLHGARVELSTDPAVAWDAAHRERALVMDERPEAREIVVVAHLDVTGLAFPITVDPAWTTIASMLEPRAGHVLVSLGGGKVLAAAGVTSKKVPTGSEETWYSDAEIYDVATNTWTAVAAPLAYRQVNAGGARLPSGKVLIVGGMGPSSERTFSQMFQTKTNDFVPTAIPNFEHGWVSMVTLSDGRVLLVGDGANCEIYDEKKDTWTKAAPMPHARNTYPGGIAKLGSGKVLVAGGNGPGELSAADVYDPSTDTWTAVAPMSVTRSLASAIDLADGRALVAGGTNAEIYDPVKDAWSPAGTMSEADGSFQLLRLGTGNVFAVHWNSKLDLFSLEKTWSKIDRPAGDGGPTKAALLDDGRVLLAGASNDPTTLTSTAEIWTPPTPAPPEAGVGDTGAAETSDAEPMDTGVSDTGPSSMTADTGGAAPAAEPKADGGDSGGCAWRASGTPVPSGSSIILAAAIAIALRRKRTR